ncbi:MAG: hypothetical protein J0H75_13580, partial [Rhizobiales bacterium]|nr:hypothetical protein [Hyphomicrobiales bacterium]
MHLADSGIGFIMSLSLKQALLLSSAPSLLLLSAFGHPAAAQDSASELPSITVTAPSPIVRHAKRPRRAASTHAARPTPTRDDTPSEQPRIVVN